MNKQLGKLLAAVLLLACLPVGAQGTESSQETVSKETGLSEGALIHVSIWQDDKWAPLQAGESWQLTNAQGQILINTAEGRSGDLPWRSIGYIGYGMGYGINDSDYYLLELDLQWIAGKEVEISILKYELDGTWCSIEGAGISSIAFTPEALTVTGQEMTYEITFSQRGDLEPLVCAEGNGESQVRFTSLQEETIQVDTQLASSTVWLGRSMELAEATAQLAPEEIALVNQAITAPGITTALPPEPESWPLALGIGAGVLAAAAIVLLRWQARRKKRPAPPEPAPERPPEADSPDSGGS